MKRWMRWTPLLIGYMLLTPLIVTAASPPGDPIAPLDRVSQCDDTECAAEDDDTDRPARSAEGRQVDPPCQSSAFRVLTAADVTLGTLIGGPYNGFPVVIVEPTGTGGVPLNVATAVPAAYTRYLPTTASGATVGGFVDGGAISVAPYAVFFAKQSLPPGSLYATDRNARTYTATPDLVALSGCE